MDNIALEEGRGFLRLTVLARSVIRIGLSRRPEDDAYISLSWATSKLLSAQRQRRLFFFFA